jgi:hypothetical protein
MKEKHRIPVPEEDRAKLFLWCARHCCFCGRECTTNIVIHHIDGDPLNNNIDNLIPVCFDCHGELERYNPDHPIGTKYRFLEIKARRDQIYELYTHQYLRQVEIRISNYNLNALDNTGELDKRKWGDISCSVGTLSTDIPVRLRLHLKPYQDVNPIKKDLGDLYSGKALWNLNPNFIVHGHIGLPISPSAEPFLFRIEIFWSIIDVLEREHEMLPISYVWNDPKKDWWFDPRIRYKKPT